MSRQDDERELRKLEYLENRGVATFADRKRQKELARKLAIQDFEISEAGGVIEMVKPSSADKKGTTN